MLSPAIICATLDIHIIFWLSFRELVKRYFQQVYVFCWVSRFDKRNSFPSRDSILERPPVLLLVGCQFMIPVLKFNTCLTYTNYISRQCESSYWKKSWKNVSKDSKTNKDLAMELKKTRNNWRKRDQCCSKWGKQKKEKEWKD